MSVCRAVQPEPGRRTLCWWEQVEPSLIHLPLRFLEKSRLSDSPLGSSFASPLPWGRCTVCLDTPFTTAGATSSLPGYLPPGNPSKEAHQNNLNPETPPGKSLNCLSLSVASLLDRSAVFGQKESFFFSFLPSRRCVSSALAAHFWLYLASKWIHLPHLQLPLWLGYTSVKLWELRGALMRWGKI